MCVSGSNSSELTVTSGILQGSVTTSVLGRTLFIIDITHLQLSDGRMTLFADDIMLYRPIRSPVDFTSIKTDIDNLTLWTDQNFLQFNAVKCK